jgi:hypothetical protein
MYDLGSFTQQPAVVEICQGPSLMESLVFQTTPSWSMFDGALLWPRIALAKMARVRWQILVSSLFRFVHETMIAGQRWSMPMLSCVEAGRICP